MYHNLDAEMARRKITRAMLAEKIGKTATTLSLKLNGKAPLTLSECIEIKNAVNPECTVDLCRKIYDIVSYQYRT